MIITKIRETHMTPAASSGVGRAKRSSTVRPVLMSLMVGVISWMESSAAPWSTMTGMDTGPVLTRHPTLFTGQRRVPPKLWGLWRTVISLVLFAMRITLKG